MIYQKKINKEKIYYLEKEKNLIQAELEFLILIQKDYYLRILKKGNESWSSGLIWVIETLAETGTIVTVNMLPNFLDKQSKQFLLKLSEDDWVIKKTETEIK